MTHEDYTARAARDPAHTTENTRVDPAGVVAAPERIRYSEPERHAGHRR
jgi:hypothetical protein